MLGSYARAYDARDDPPLGEMGDGTDAELELCYWIVG